MKEEDKPHSPSLSGPVDETRRTFLRLGLVVPLLSVSLLLPTRLLAATTKNTHWLEPTIAKGSALPPERKPSAPRLLLIDPGHGGHDPGAIGLSGTKEKDVVLDIALRMADAFSGVRGVEAKLTREQDVFLSLGARAQMGRAQRADFFISVHADSAPNATARGLSAYTLSDKASDKFASMLADKENKVDISGGQDFHVEDKEVANILFDLTARRTRNTAQRVKVGFIKGMGRRWQLLEQPMRSANFAVLRQPDIPAMLVETGFLSNAKDESILKQAAQRQKIARLMVDELSFLLRSPLFG